MSSPLPPPRRPSLVHPWFFRPNFRPRRKTTIPLFFLAFLLLSLALSFPPIKRVPPPTFPPNCFLVPWFLCGHPPPTPSCNAPIGGLSGFCNVFHMLSNSKWVLVLKLFLFIVLNQLTSLRTPRPPYHPKEAGLRLRPPHLRPSGPFFVDRATRRAVRHALRCASTSCPPPVHRALIVCHSSFKISFYLRKSRGEPCGGYTCRSVTPCIAAL